MAEIAPSEMVVHKFLNHPRMNEVLRGKVHAGHFNKVHSSAENPLNAMFQQINDIANDHPRFKGGSTGMGGNISVPGGSYMMGGSLHMGGNIKNHEELYHFVLNLSPHEVECLREIAVQIMGGLPSRMWGKLIPKDEEHLESDQESYEHIVRMPNSHAMARMVEAEGSSKGEGGGFGKALKHVAKIGSKIYKAGHHALKFVNRNKDLLYQLPGVKDYTNEIDAFLETANRVDDAVNPIVDATIDAVKEDATQADKDKLKKMAESSIKRVVEQQVPNGKEIVQLANEVKRSVNDYKNTGRFKNVAANS